MLKPLLEACHMFIPSPSLTDPAPQPTQGKRPSLAGEPFKLTLELPTCTVIMNTALPTAHCALPTAHCTLKTALCAPHQSNDPLLQCSAGAVRQGHLQG